MMSLMSIMITDLAILVSKNCCTYSKGTSFKEKYISADYVHWTIWSDMESVYNHYESDEWKEQETELFYQFHAY